MRFRSKDIVFIPEPEVGGTVQDSIGERWVVVMASRGFVHLVRHRSTESQYMTRKTWDQSFRDGGWLTI